MCWALTWRAGTFPSFVLASRTPRNAGESPTTPIDHCSSTRIFEISWAVLFRSASFWTRPAVNSWMAFRSCGSAGFRPSLPPLANHR